MSLSTISSSSSAILPSSEGTRVRASSGVSQQSVAVVHHSQYCCRLIIALTTILLTQLRPLKLRDTQAPLRQLGADLVDLPYAIVVLEARKLPAVVAGLVVDLGVVGLAAGLLELVQHEGDFGG